MPNTISVHNFPSPYSHLHSLQVLQASRADITRSLLAVGYSSKRQALLKVGLWRARLLVSLVRGYLDRDLSTTAYFRNLEQSEKAAMSFLLAQAFTHWFGETHMDLDYLVHVQGTSNWRAAAAGLQLKQGAGPAVARGRPDFIGRSTGAYHVFESKGRTRSGLTQSMKSALTQVSAISTVNGLAPTTRVGACFHFSQTGVTGLVQDPPAAPTAYDVEFDEKQAVQKVYAFFLEPEIRAQLSEDVSGFLSFRFQDDTRYGIDQDVLVALDSFRSKPTTRREASEVLEVVRHKKPDFKRRRDTSLSVGTDGTLILSPDNS